MHTCTHLNGVLALFDLANQGSHWQGSLQVWRGSLQVWRGSLRFDLANQGSLQVWRGVGDQDSITLAPHILVVVRMLSHTLNPDLLSRSCGCDAVCWVIVLAAQLVFRRT